MMASSDLSAASLPPPPPCLAPSFFDCSGVCIPPSSCVLSSFGYAECLSWLGDGCCQDASYPYLPDDAFLSSSNPDFSPLNHSPPPNFNCPFFGCDGGDCESCGEDHPYISSTTTSSSSTFPFFSSAPSSWQSRCRDMSLQTSSGSPTTCPSLVSSGSFSCAQHFCDDCELAGLCDDFCGLCTAPPKPPPREGDVEPAPEPAAAAERGGDGGGGEEGEQWCVLLTAAVCPKQGMTHTKRLNPLLRLRDYVKSVSSWSSILQTSLSFSEPPPKLFFVESSGANLDPLRDASHGGISFISTSSLSSSDMTPQPPNSSPASRSATSRLGKGVAEYSALTSALSSPAMSSCSKVVKVTGRYFVPSLLAEIERIRQEEAVDKAERERACRDGVDVGVAGGVELVLQSTPNFWNMWESDGGISRSEVVGFDKRLVQFIFEGQNEEEGLPMERIIKLRSRELSNVKYFGRMEIEKTRNAEGVWIHDL